MVHLKGLQGLIGCCSREGKMTWKQRFFRFHKHCTLGANTLRTGCWGIIPQLWQGHTGIVMAFISGFISSPFSGYLALWLASYTKVFGRSTKLASFGAYGRDLGLG